MTTNPTFPLLVQAGLVWLGTTTWSDLGRKIVDSYYPYGKESVHAMTVYTVLLTVIILLLIWLIGQLTNYNYTAAGQTAAAQVARVVSAHIPE